MSGQAHPTTKKNVQVAQVGELQLLLGLLGQGLKELLLLLRHNHLIERLHLYFWVVPVRHDVVLACCDLESLARLLELLLQL